MLDLRHPAAIVCAIVCAAPASLLAVSASAASVDQLQGTWQDKDGGVYTIEARDGRPVLTKAMYGNEKMTVMESRWSAGTFEFQVRLVSENVLVNYRIVGATQEGLDTVWWNNIGDGGREVLTRQVEAVDPQRLLGVWEDRSLKDRYWIELVGDKPVLIGGVDARGKPIMVTARDTREATATWTVHVPKSGYKLTYTCTPSASSPNELACSWHNISPEGTRRDGQEALRRITP